MTVPSELLSVCLENFNITWHNYPTDFCLLPVLSKIISYYIPIDPTKVNSEW